ncbi:hypothetical protein ACRRTK_007486 [Alexandromys fortis]
MSLSRCTAFTPCPLSARGFSSTNTSVQFEAICRVLSLSLDPLHPKSTGVENILRGAQELDNIIKQGYLEKKSKDHSFFGSEWQKRWCVVSRGLFLYYANEKSKQPKGTFFIKGYSVRMAPHLRKDSKKEACFELTSQDRRSYEFTALNPAEARDWVDQISFLLKDESHDLEEDASGTHGWRVDCANYYQGLWDCHGDQPDELSFQRGDLIRILSKEYNMYGWWVGELNSIVGIVPKDYLTAAFETEER